MKHTKTYLSVYSSGSLKEHRLIFDIAAAHSDEWWDKQISGISESDGDRDDALRDLVKNNVGGAECNVVLHRLDSPDSVLSQVADEVKTVIRDAVQVKLQTEDWPKA